VADALDDIEELRTDHPGTRFLVGGRVSLDTITITSQRADGAILGSAIKRSRAADARVSRDIAAKFGAAVAQSRSFSSSK
ncbi:MAG: hypothetical protein ABWY93_19925, partial [Mycobacterium sp.]